MKLKFKYTETKKFLLNFDKETLGELTTSVKNFIADSYGDNLDAVALSLNGHDPLLGSNKTLKELGIVSSDLIMILTGDLALAAMIHNSEQGNEGELTSNNGPSKDAFSSESISSTSKEKADHGAASSNSQQSINMPNERCNYILYRDRKEWSDLTPIKQNDGPHPVVKIAYSPEFEDVFDYFRGVVAVGELSRRALELTDDCIEFNAANYTVWQYRRQILKHINGDLNKELSFCREMIEFNPKNYQVWHHRRVIVEWLGDSSRELRLTQIIFSQDSKNYHAWEHRQWALRTFNIYQGELEFNEKLLIDDIRNNSAWNHRYFVLSRTSGLTIDVLRRELDFVQKAISKLQDNESPWTYMKGLLQDTSAEDSELDECWKDTEHWCWELLKTTLKVDNVDASAGDVITNITKGSISPHLLIGILDCICYKLEKLPQGNEKKDAINNAQLICDGLAVTHDSIRSKYWQYSKRQLISKHTVGGDTCNASVANGSPNSYSQEQKVEA